MEEGSCKRDIRLRRDPAKGILDGGGILQKGSQMQEGSCKRDIRLMRAPAKGILDGFNILEKRDPWKEGNRCPTMSPHVHDQGNEYNLLNNESDLIFMIKEVNIISSTIESSYS